MSMEQNNSLNVQDMVFNREDVKVDSSLDTTSEDTSEDTTENSSQSGDEQQHGTEREVDENQIDRLEIAVRLFVCKLLPELFGEQPHAQCCLSLPSILPV